MLCATPAPDQSEECTLRALVGLAPRNLYVGGSNGLWRSLDGGATFGKTGESDSVEALWTDGSDLFMAATPTVAHDGYFIERSQDQGSTWTAGVGAGDHTSGLDPVAWAGLDGQNGQIVGVGTITSYDTDGPDGISETPLLLISRNDGVGWKGGWGAFTAAGDELTAVTGGPSALLVSGKRGTFRSTDGADTWTRVAPWTARGMTTDGDAVYAVGKRGRMYRSVDGGASWASLPLPVTVKADLDTVWAGGGSVVTGGGCSSSPPTPVLLQSP
jgi:photosystem II stability/assembly factor-like uncharacterized protein